MPHGAVLRSPPGRRRGGHPVHGLPQRDAADRAGRGVATLEVVDLGLVAYAEGLRRQDEAARARREGSGPDTLFLLEHPHVITLGRNSLAGNLLVPRESLAGLGVELHEAGRGGDVTYHGPGQLVGYPVLLLPDGRHDVKRYVRDLEAVLIGALADLGIAAGREPGLTGVWVGSDKIGAIGVRISRWLTSHGFALNVSTDLSFFRLITPCGIVGRGVTSMERLLGRAPGMHEVKAAVARQFRARFEGEIHS